MPTLTGSLRAQPSIKYNSDNASLTDKQISVLEAFSLNFTNGTGLNQADLLFSIKRVGLGTSATDTYELDDASMKDPLGNGLTFVKIKGIILFHESSSLASAISAGGDFVTTNNLGTNSLSPGSHNQNGEVLGYTIVAGTGDTYTVVNADGSNVADYTLIFIGTSA